MLDRRTLLSRSLKLAGSAALATSPVGSMVLGGNQTAIGATHGSKGTTLTLYLTLWRCTRRASLLPWNTPSPEVLAESFMHLVWEYLQVTGPYGTRHTRLKPHLVGHAAILAVFRKADGETERLVLSNTGTVEIGIYRHPALPKLTMSPLKFPLRKPYIVNREAPVLAAAKPVEMLLGHNRTGFWESYRQFRKRVASHFSPRVERITIKGSQAEDSFEILKLIGGQPEGSPRLRRDRLEAAPSHYGLNANEIRLLHDFDNPRRVATRLVNGKPLIMPGGCGNATAAILDFIELGKHVPRNKAAFSVSLSQDAMADAVFPITMAQDAFGRNGRLTAPSLRAELEQLPDTWGKGETASFIDPNHWHSATVIDNSALDELRRELNLF